MSQRTLQALKEMTAEVEFLKEQNNILKKRVVTCNNQKNLYRENLLEANKELDLLKELNGTIFVLRACDLKMNQTI